LFLINFCGGVLRPPFPGNPGKAIRPDGGENSYSVGAYRVRPPFPGNSGKAIRPDSHQPFLTMTELHHALKTSADYQALPAKVSQLVLKQVAKTFKSFQKAQEQFKKSPNKLTGEPKLPRYKDKKKGRNV